MATIQLDDGTPGRRQIGRRFAVEEAANNLRDFCHSQGLPRAETVPVLKHQKLPIQ
jgi:hypothetical protein